MMMKEDDKWWLLPTILLLWKTIQARFVDWHIANLEIKDYSLFALIQILFGRMNLSINTYLTRIASELSSYYIAKIQAK
ncbi:hypothetical protein G4B88_014746, partial [Cannabis sativa]